ncbi:MAG: S9 family peptidase, partial [Gammaproteobacteria bacterium]|nr:S9 family peptidase [Gammaproteobacteria bacterium]
MRGIVYRPLQRSTTMSSRSTTASGLALGILMIGAGTALAAPFTAQDLNTLARVADPQVSPDGRYVVYALRETDMEANRGRTDLWLLDLADGKSLSSPRRLTRHPAADSSPRWAADGSGVFLLSSRGGSSQIWHISLAGGEAQQVTSLPLDVGSFEVSPKGDRLAVSMEVFPDCADLQCTTDRQAAQSKKKASGKAYEQLFVRHWDTWSDGTLSTLFTVTLDKDMKVGAPVNVSGKVRGHVPSKPFGGDADYAFSPDGTRLVFSARLADRSESWSTNFDLYEVAADGSGEPRNLTADNPAWDAQPVFLANGDLAWLAMSRPGFEADRYAIKVQSAKDGRVRTLLQDWDR